MSYTTIIAALEEKGVLSRDEGEKLVEFINNKPQPTVLNDAVSQVKEVLASAEQKIAPVVKQIEEKAAEITSDVENEVKKAVKAAKK